VRWRREGEPRDAAVAEASTCNGSVKGDIDERTDLVGLPSIPTPAYHRVPTQESGVVGTSIWRETTSSHRAIYPVHSVLPHFRSRFCDLLIVQARLQT
jgi:hypothetical protein